MTQQGSSAAILQLTFQISDPPSHSRGMFCASFASLFTPLKEEGAGKTGSRLAPISSRFGASDGWH
jgi:hypothetical protein